MKGDIIADIVAKANFGVLDAMNLNVRISGSLSDFVSEAISDGDYENVSEYVRDLIRRDKERAEREAFEAMRLRLQNAFAMPDLDYEYLSADDIRRRALAAAER